MHCCNPVEGSTCASEALQQSQDDFFAGSDTLAASLLLSNCNISPVFTALLISKLAAGLRSAQNDRVQLEVNFAGLPTLAHEELPGLFECKHENFLQRHG